MPIRFFPGYKSILFHCKPAAFARRCSRPRAGMGEAGGRISRRLCRVAETRGPRREVGAKKQGVVFVIARAPFLGSHPRTRLSQDVFLEDGLPVGRNDGSVGEMHLTTTRSSRLDRLGSRETHIAAEVRLSTLSVQAAGLMPLPIDDYLSRAYSGRCFFRFETRFPTLGALRTCIGGCAFARDSGALGHFHGDNRGRLLPAAGSQATTAGVCSCRSAIGT